MPFGVVTGCICSPFGCKLHISTGCSVSSISPALAQQTQVFHAASPVQKSVLQAVWLWSILFTLPTTEGHLDLNGLAMHH